MTPEPRTPRSVLRAALSASIDSNGTPARDQPDAGRRPRRRAAASSPGFGEPGAGARLQPPLRLAQLVLERADPVRRSASTDWAPSGRRPRPRAPSNRSRTSASAPSPVTASMRRIPEPMLRSPVIRKPPIWPRRPAVRAAAQLEAVVLDADRPDRLAVLLVEEGVRAALDRLGHAHERDGDGPVVADDAVDLVLDRRAARRRSAPRSNGKSKRR